MPLLGYIILLVGSSLIGGLTSTIMGLLVRVMTANEVLLDLKSLGLIGAVIGGVMGGCMVLKLMGVGDYMSDTVLIGTTMYRYSDKIVQENYFDYVYYFSGFAWFIVNTWAYNPPMESATFLSDVLCLALGAGGAFLVYFLILKLSELLER